MHVGSNPAVQARTGRYDRWHGMLAWQNGPHAPLWRFRKPAAEVGMPIQGAGDLWQESDMR